MRDIKEESMNLILFYKNMLGNRLHDVNHSKTSQDLVVSLVSRGCAKKRGGVG